jgi:hypothetical protein
MLQRPQHSWTRLLKVVTLGFTTTFPNKTSVHVVEACALPYKK